MYSWTGTSKAWLKTFSCININTRDALQNVRPSLSVFLYSNNENDPTLLNASLKIVQTRYTIFQYKHRAKPPGASNSIAITGQSLVQPAPTYLGQLLVLKLQDLHVHLLESGYGPYEYGLELHLLDGRLGARVPAVSHPLRHFGWLLSSPGPATKRKVPRRRQSDEASHRLAVLLSRDCGEELGRGGRPEKTRLKAGRLCCSTRSLYSLVVPRAVWKKGEYSTRATLRLYDEEATILMLLLESLGAGDAATVLSVSQRGIQPTESSPGPVDDEPRIFSLSQSRRSRVVAGTEDAIAAAAAVLLYLAGLGCSWWLRGVAIYGALGILYFGALALSRSRSFWCGLERADGRRAEGGKREKSKSDVEFGREVRAESGVFSKLDHAVGYLL